MTKRPPGDPQSAGQTWGKARSSYMGTGYNPGESLLSIGALGATLAPMPSETNTTKLTLDQCIKHISRSTENPNFESSLLNAGDEVVNRFHELKRMEQIWRKDGYDEEVIKDHFAGPLADLERDAQQLLNRFEQEGAKLNDITILRDLNKSIRALPDTVSSETRCELYRQVADIAGQLGSIPLHVKSITNDTKPSPDKQQILHELALKRTLQNISSLQREIKILTTKMPASVRIEPIMRSERETQQSAQSGKVDQALSQLLVTRAIVNRLAKRVTELEIRQRESASNGQQAVTSQITLELLLKRVAKLEIQLRDIYSVGNGQKSATTSIICGGIGANTTSKATAELKVEDTVAKAIESTIETILQEKDEGAKNAPPDTACRPLTGIMSSRMPQGPTPTPQTTGLPGWTDNLLSDPKRSSNTIYGGTQDIPTQSQAIRFRATQTFARRAKGLSDTAADLARVGYILRVKEDELTRHENATTAWSRNASTGITFKESDTGAALTDFSMFDIGIKTLISSAKNQMAQLEKKAVMARLEIKQWEQQDRRKTIEMNQQSDRLTQQLAQIDQHMRNSEYRVCEIMYLNNTIQSMVNGIALQFKNACEEVICGYERDEFAYSEREKELAAREQRILDSERIVRARLANVAAYRSNAMEITTASVRENNECGMSRKGWSDVQELIQGVKGLYADGDEEIKSVRRLAESVERELESMLWRKKDGVREIDTEKLAVAMKQGDEKILAESKAEEQEEITGAIQKDNGEKLAAAMKQEDEKILAESKAEEQEEITGAIQKDIVDKLAAILEDDVGQGLTGAPKYEAEDITTALWGKVDNPTTPIDEDIDIVLVNHPRSP